MYQVQIVDFVRDWRPAIPAVDAWAVDFCGGFQFYAANFSKISVLCAAHICILSAVFSKLDKDISCVRKIL